MRSPTFKTKQRSYQSLSPDVRRRTAEAVEAAMNEAFYQHDLYRAENERKLYEAIKKGGKISFTSVNGLELVRLYAKLTGLYLVPSKDVADRARHRRLIEAEARRIAKETNAPLVSVWSELLLMMRDYV